MVKIGDAKGVIYIRKVTPQGAARIWHPRDTQTDPPGGSTGPGAESDIYDWRRGVVVSGVRRMNKVNARRARLVPGSTVFGRVYHLGM